MDLDCVSQYKNCVKGIPCGNTCISKGKNCKPKPNAQINAVANLLTKPDNLEKGAETSELKQAPKENEKTQLLKEKPEPFKAESKIGENPIETTIKDKGMLAPIKPPPYIQDINIKVGGSWGKQGIEGKDGLKLALASKEHVREYIKNAPNGTLLSNSPYAGDGFGDQRAKLYEKAGFSPRDSKDNMYAIVKDGKAVPITFKEIKELKKSGSFK